MARAPPLGDTFGLVNGEGEVLAGHGGEGVDRVLALVLEVSLGGRPGFELARDVGGVGQGEAAGEVAVVDGPDDDGGGACLSLAGGEVELGGAGGEVGCSLVGAVVGVERHGQGAAAGGYLRAGDGEGEVLAGHGGEGVDRVLALVLEVSLGGRPGFELARDVGGVGQGEAAGGVAVVDGADDDGGGACLSLAGGEVELGGAGGEVGCSLVGAVVGVERHGQGAAAGGYLRAGDGEGEVLSGHGGEGVDRVLALVLEVSLGGYPGFELARDVGGVGQGEAAGGV